MTGTKGHSGGKRPGQGRPKSGKPTGKRKHFYLSPDNETWWNSLPERGRSEVINQLIRDAKEKEPG